jgi:hypothetical protein
MLALESARGTLLNGRWNSVMPLFAFQLCVLTSGSTMLTRR